MKIFVFFAGLRGEAFGESSPRVDDAEPVTFTMPPARELTPALHRRPRVLSQHTYYRDDVLIVTVGFAMMLPVKKHGGRCCVLASLGVSAN